jgi:hypothetical protein
MPAADRGVRAGAELEKILAGVFRKAGWRVRRPSSSSDSGVDLILNRSGKRYIVQLKVSSEGRRDRLIPLLSQGVLEAQAAAQRSGDNAVPVAVVAAQRIPVSVAAQVKKFAERYAPNVGIGAIDAEGLRVFTGPGIEGLDAKPPRRLARQIVSPKRIPDLFSDLNQWMLKILVGQGLPESLISVPREPIRNASQLAEAAKVSIMSASRLVNQLTSRGFLDESEQTLRVVRAGELLEWWTSSNREAAKEVPARWILKGGQHQLLAALRQSTSRQMHNQPRCCLGLFAAADALGFGFVRGAPAHIYLERLTLDSLDRLGLAIGHSDRPADVIVRIPVNREAIFRAIAMHDGVPVSDVLQVWLDVSTHPARGRAQADEIRRRVLKPLFGKQL